MLEKEGLSIKSELNNSSVKKVSEVRLYGAGGHSQVIKETLGAEDIVVNHYFDDNQNRKHHLVPKVNEGVRKDIDAFPHQGPPFIISVGNNRERSEIASMLKSKFHTAIHNTAIVSPKATIGEGTVVFAGAIIQPNTSIGKHVIINTGASIDHDNIIGDYAHISPQAALCGHVEIGEGTHIGVSACVIPQVKIGKWCTIGAGAVVIKDVPDYSTVVGNPGKIIKTSIPKRSNSYNDIVFIGSGISASFTILKLLEQYKNDKRLLRLSIIEKSNEFHTGIPYGYRSSDSTLLIKPLFQFLPEGELKLFTQWLSENKGWLIDGFLSEGGHLSQKWLDENKNAIDKNDWNNLYLPRRFFGKYISLVVNKKINSAVTSRLLSIDYIKDEVVSVEQYSDEYSIKLKNDSLQVKTKKIVLAIGGAPNRKLFSVNDISLSKNKGLLIEDPYEPSLEEVFKQIKQFIDTQQKQKVNILVVGTNASGIELVYKLNDYKEVSSKIDQLFALSPQNKFPDPRTDIDPSIKFVPSSLIKLTKEDKITASHIAKAAKEDLDKAEQSNISSIYTIKPISEVFCSLLDRLNPEEKRKFAAHVGNEIGKRQREAGSHYSEVVSLLYVQNRLTNVKGKFSGIASTSEDGLQFAYEANKQVRTFDKPIDIIINCAGGCDIQSPQNENTLISNLVKNNICEINPSNRGILVNDSFESSQGFYINGPLLGGNVIDQQPIWHVEHAGRISTLSEKLAKILYKELSSTTKYSKDLVKV